MEATRDTTPFILSGFATNQITAGVAGIEQSFPSAGLVNPLAVPIEVTEIMVTSTALGSGFGADSIFPTELLLRAGRHGLTNGRVPTYALGPLYTDTYGEKSVALASGSTLSAFTSRWVLPAPMLLRAGEALSGAVGLSSAFSYAGITATVKTQITARARRCPPGTNPPTSQYPFVSGGYFTAANVPLQDLAFQNVFPVPLTVSAILCMRGGIIESAQIPPWAATTGVAGVTLIGPSGAGAGARRTIASDTTPLLFGPRGAIEVSFVLDPNEALRATLTSPIDQAGAITIMGRREESA